MRRKSVRYSSTAATSLGCVVVMRSMSPHARAGRKRPASGAGAESDPHPSRSPADGRGDRMAGRYWPLSTRMRAASSKVDVTRRASQASAPRA